MAKQIGPHFIQGTFNGITYYKTSYGWLARKKTNLSKSRLKNDPHFENTRHCMSEFKNTSHAAKVFRIAFRQCSHYVADSSLCNRTFSAMSKVIKSDCTSPFGHRNAVDGDLNLMLGFEFNKTARFNRIFAAPYSAQFDRAQRIVTTSIEAFIPSQTVEAPPGSTHFRIFVCAAPLDFQGHSIDFAIEYFQMLEFNDAEVPKATQQLRLEPNSALPVAVVMGVQFFSYTNGIHSPLKTGNACQVVLVDKP